MDIPKIIKEQHQAMIDKGFYDCPECTERLKLKQELGAGCHDEIGCELYVKSLESIPTKT